jgi:radical SAM superfamily enzyme YgiQ (UPF0313 family)
MRVLFISENRSRANLVPYPIGISCVAAAARRAGHDVYGLDLMWSDDPPSDIAAAVRRFEPDCVGLSVRNIDNQDMRHPVSYVSEVIDIVGAVKGSTGAPIVAGGAGFTIFPLECLRYLDLELGLIGEAEDSFPLLLERLGAGLDPAGVPGLARYGHTENIVNRRLSLPDISRSPSPDRLAFPVDRYDWAPGRNAPFIANIQSRRGCHMECVYCSNPIVEGNRVRMRDPAVVVDELQGLEEQGISTVWFVDSLFNYPVDYARELCVRISERGLSIRWICTFSPTASDPGLFSIMRDAGCFQLSVGNESGSDLILDSLKKGFTKKDVAVAVSRAREEGLGVNCFLLLGGPGETRETVEESVEFVASLEPDMVTVTPGIRIYPGCELHRIAISEGVVKKDQGLLAPTFYVSPEVEPWLYDYAEEICSSNDGWKL